MATTTTKTKLTVEEFRDRYAEDPRQLELVDGEVVVSEPRARHALVQGRLITALGMWSQAAPGRPHPLGVTGVRLTEHDSYGPDLVVVAPDAPLDERGYLARLPLVAVELRSPSTRRYDVGHKKRTYEAQGLPELWLVDLEADTVLVFRRSAHDAPDVDVALELTTDDALASPQLPGFGLALSTLLR